MAEFNPELAIPVGAPARFENISEEDKKRVIKEFKVKPVDQPNASPVKFDPSKALPVNQPEKASMTKEAVPVLREQPSALEEATQPGGIASAENLGMLGGGATGALYGSAFGPVGTFLGGVLGAGAGAMGGRGYEMALEHLLGPYKTQGTEPLKKPNRSAGDVVSEIGEASQRGMMGQAMGEGTGAAIGAVGKKILAPFAARAATPEARQAAATASEHGIDLLTSERTGSTRAAQLEAFAKRGAGREKAQAFAENRSQQIKGALGNFADSLSPGLSNDLQSVSDVTKAAAEGRLKGMKAMTDKLVSQVAGGTPKDATTSGESVQTGKEKLLDATMAEAGRIYDAVKAQAGNAVNAVKSQSFKSIADEIATKESKLTGVEVQSAGVARGAQSQFPKKPKPVMGPEGEPIDPASVPAALIKNFGLDKEKIWDFDTLRSWQSRLGALMSSTKNRVAARDFARMYGAVTDDIAKWGEKLDPRVNELLKTANDFYRTKVADVYYDRLVSKIDKADPDVVASLFIKPNGSTVMMDRVKTAIGADAFKDAAGSYLDKLMAGAHNPQTGRFDPLQVLQRLNSHSPEVLQRLFGKQITAEEGLVKLFQRNPTQMITSILDTPGDKIVDMLVPKRGTAEKINTLRQLLPSKNFDQFAGGVMHNIAENSMTRGDRHFFSLDRFLTQVNDRSGYTQGQQRALLGDQYGDFRKLVDVLERMKHMQGMTDNPSGTAQAVMSAAHIGGGIMLASDFAGKTVTGQEDSSQFMRHVGEGLLLASPNIIGKAMYTKGGIHWLTEGLTAPPGSKQAVKAIGELTKALSAPVLGTAISRDKEPSKNDISLNQVFTPSNAQAAIRPVAQVNPSQPDSQQAFMRDATQAQGSAQADLDYAQKTGGSLMARQKSLADELKTVGVKDLTKIWPLAKDQEKRADMTDLSKELMSRMQANKGNPQWLKEQLGAKDEKELKSYMQTLREMLTHRPHTKEEKLSTEAR